MNAECSTAEMTDALARIEMQRQERQKESGVPMSCSWALGKLHELFPRERKPPGTNGESTALQANIEATTLAIGRLRKLARTTSQRATLKSGRPWHQQESWRDAQKKSSGIRPRKAKDHPDS